MSFRRLPAVWILLAWAASAMPASGEEVPDALELDVAVVVYTHTFTSRVDWNEVEGVRAEVAEAVARFSRASRGRLRLALKNVRIDRLVPQSDFCELEPGSFWLGAQSPDGARRVEDDFRDLGFRDDDLDAVAVFYAWENRVGEQSRYGGATYGVNTLLGKAAYLAIPMAWPRETLNQYFEHEMLHVIESIFREADQPIAFVHNAEVAQAVYGDDLAWHEWILQSIPDATYLAVASHRASGASVPEPEARE